MENKISSASSIPHAELDVYRKKERGRGYTNMCDRIYTLLGTENTHCVR